MIVIQPKRVGSPVIAEMSEAAFKFNEVQSGFPVMQFNSGRYFLVQHDEQIVSWLDSNKLERMVRDPLEKMEVVPSELIHSKWQRDEVVVYVVKDLKKSRRHYSAVEYFVRRGFSLVDATQSAGVVAEILLAE